MMAAAKNKVKVLRSSKARLLAVADIVESNDGRWNQNNWSADGVNMDYPNEHEEVLLVNSAHTCGSYGCIAGWAVAMYPNNFEKECSWEGAGAMALGLESEELGEILFDGELGEHLRPDVRRRRVSKVLRYLAEFPPSKRTIGLNHNIYLILDGKKPRR